MKTTVGQTWSPGAPLAWRRIEPLKAIHLHEFVDRHHKGLVISLSDHMLRITTKSAMHFNLKQTTCSDPKPAGVPI